MSDPVEYSPAQIEQKILEISSRIANSVRVCDERYRAFMAADLDFDRAFAKAYLAYEGPQQERRYAAVAATAELRDVRDEADAAYRFAKDLREALNAELDAFRSVGVSVRQAWSVAGRGEGA